MNKDTEEGLGNGKRLKRKPQPDYSTLNYALRFGHCILRNRGPLEVLEGL